jgi:hypothetical protein
MPFTCEGTGSLWPDVAWRLALLAPNLAPGDIVSRVNVRTAVANFEARISVVNDQRPAIAEVTKWCDVEPGLGENAVIRPGQYCICLSRVLISAVSWPMPCVVLD